MKKRRNRESFDDLTRTIVQCRKCPRLVKWREHVAREKRAAFRQESYWGRPLPSFGDSNAELLVVGLAPAAHGANRTGRMFTGDRSGDWLYRALHTAGFANQPESTNRDDGLFVTNVLISAAVRCAPPENKPTTEERDRCLPYLAEELRLLTRLKAIVCLGGYAWTAVLRLWNEQGTPIRPKPKFGHGASYQAPGGITVLGSFHPSQQNTFTGRLTVPMLNKVFVTARELLTNKDARSKAQPSSNASAALR